MSIFDRQGITGWVLKPSKITKDAIRAGDLDEARDGDSGSATDELHNMAHTQTWSSLESSGHPFTDQAERSASIE